MGVYWLAGVLFAMVMALRFFTQTPVGKGIFGEWVVGASMRLFLPKGEYVSVNDIYLRRPNGETSQIDHCIFSRYGIFVLETKNMAGIISGSARGREWTQSFRGGQRFRFLNPLFQNEGHIEALSGFLGIPKENIHSVICFIGDAKPSRNSVFPENVLFGGFVTHIRQKERKVFSEEELREMVERVRKGRLQATKEVRSEHIERIRSRRGG